MKFAIIHNWPGQKNSELEIIIRIRRIAKKFGHNCIVIDPFGHPLTDDGKHMDRVKFIDAKQYDFCLNLHYVNPSIIDTFSYAVNWNPLDYIIRNPIDGSNLPLEDIAFRTACLSSHDVILSAGSSEMDDFVQALNFTGKTQIFNDKLCLHTTSEVYQNIDFPNFENFRVFYIGANWERQNGEKRHGGLIEYLDSTNIVDFYGVEKQHGIYLWEGIKNYQGELSFDGGNAIVKCSNKCGVSLVLHSKPHRKSGLVSTRIFQACAAKTLIVCDDNPFILKYFGDSVLSFSYSDKPDQNFNNIMEKIEWVKNNPHEAAKKAQRAHQIFKEKFSLEKEILNIINSHQKNINTYLAELGASDPSTMVDVIYVCRGGDFKNLELFFSDLSAQVNVRPQAVVYALSSDVAEIERIAKEYGVTCEIIQWKDFIEDTLPLNGRLISDHLNKRSKSKYFAFYSSKCRWFKLHLTQLVRVLENGGSIAMAETFVKNEEFEELLNEYYIPAMLSIGGHPQGITTQDLSNFNAGRFAPAAFLFLSSDFRNKELLKVLQFFNRGWFFFLILWIYLNTKRLPDFCPKLTVMFKQQDKKWGVDSYHPAAKEEQFEHSLIYSIFKNSPVYLSLIKNSQVSGSFSINKKINDVLKNRPLLLRIYHRLFKGICFLLKLPYKSF